MVQTCTVGKTHIPAHLLQDEAITEEVPPIEYNEDDETEGGDTVKILNFPGVDRKILEEQALDLCSTIEFNEDDEIEGGETIKVLNFPGVDRKILEEQVLSLCSPLEFDTNASIVVVENTGPDPSGGRSSYQQ